jgi:HSP20 family protein
MTPVVKKVVPEVVRPEVTRGAVFFTPRVDIYETPEELVFLCDLPGVTPADLKLRFVHGELILHGKVPPPPALTEFLVEEYGVGDFYRSFTLPIEVVPENIKAVYKEGVLTVHLPKPEKVLPKQIPITVA